MNEMPPPTPQVATTSNPISKKIFLIIGIIFILILIIGFGYRKFLANKQSSANKTTAPPKVSDVNNQLIKANSQSLKVIAQVGKESIYQKDLDYILTYQPTASGSAGINTRVLLTKELVDNSIILQGAQDAGLITLDSSVFNSPDKDYTKRHRLVNKLKDQITDQATHISGTVVSMWFVNGDVGPLGLNKSKEIVFGKISALQQDVKSGKITLQNAIDQIKNDSSLAQIDKSYKTNASFNFSVNPGQKITLDSTFDKMLWTTDKDDVTDLALAKAKNQQTGQLEDAVYMFGQISDKVTSLTTDFNSWLEQQRKKYEIHYY